MKRWLVLGSATFVMVFFALLFLGNADSKVDDAKGLRSPDVERQPLAGEAVGRKNIYDRNYRELAVSFRLISIYAMPLELADINSASEEIAPLLGLDREELKTLLKTERSFVWLGRRLQVDRAEKILGLNIAGIYGIDEMHRFYPHSELAAPVLGFTKDDRGLAGIEFQYDDLLRGIVGNNIDFVDSGLFDDGVVADKGSGLVLNLDLRLQNVLEDRLGKVMKKAKADTGAAIIMDADSGAILAMAGMPAYDPNSFWEFDAGEHRNRAICDPVFPGGINRLFKGAAAYESQGKIKATGGKENNLVWRQLQEGVFVSKNLMYIAEPGAEPEGLSFAEFVKNSPLRSGSGIDLPAETGSVPRQQYFTGGLTESTTAIDLLTAFAWTVNGGIQVKPRLLKGVATVDGECSASEVKNDGDAVFRAGMGKALVDVFGHGSKRPQALIVESRISAQRIENSLYNGLHVIAGVTDQAVPDGLPPVANGEGADRFYATMLGKAPEGGPNLVMVATMSEAMFDPASSSPLAEMGREILRKSVMYDVVGSVQPATLPAVNEEALCDAWLKMQKKPEPCRVKAAATRKAGVMPDVSGNSLRKALQLLQAYGVPIVVQGSGRVVEQQPAAGSSLKGLQEMVVSLQLEQ